MVIFINTLSSILIEKELKLRMAMGQMGLKVTVYWMSTLVSSIGLVSVGSFTTCVFGWILGFNSFRRTDISLLFVIFFLFGTAMIAFGFFISTLFHKAATGLFVGIFVFIFGLLFESFVFSTGYVGYIWYKPSTPAFLAHILSLLPFFNFGRLFLDISTLTTGKYDLITKSYFPGTGFPWSAVAKAIPSDLLPIYGDGSAPIVPAPIISIIWLLFNIMLYMLLAVYLDQVLPDEYGHHESLFFFLKPIYWGFAPKGTTEAGIKWLGNLGMNNSVKDANEHSSVIEEQSRALSTSISRLKQNYGQDSKLYIFERNSVIGEAKISMLLFKTFA